MTEGLWPASAEGPRRVQWGRAALAVIVTAMLLTLVVANIAVRFSWVEVEDGILWEARAEGVVAASVGPEASGARAGIRAGDVLVGKCTPIEVARRLVGRRNDPAERPRAGSHHARARTRRQ